jgi:hypothetical protein
LRLCYFLGMDNGISKDARVRALVAAALEGRLTDSGAGELAALDRSLIKLAFLAAARRIAELQGKVALAGPDHPSTPSGQKPPYVKPPAPRRRGCPFYEPHLQSVAGGCQDWAIAMKETANGQRAAA